MNTLIRIIKLVFAAFLILSCAKCFPIVTYNHTRWIKENDPKWGHMSPGCQLICTKRQFILQADFGGLVVDPFFVDVDRDHNSRNARPTVVGYLNPGEELTVHKLQARNTVSTGWLRVYTTDKYDRAILVILPEGGEGGVTDEEWIRMGFKLLKEAKFQP